MRPGGRRYRTVLVVLVAALVGSILLAVAIGAVWVPPADAVRILGWKLGLIPRPGGVSRATEVILLQLRLPRVLLAGAVGLSLAVAGTLFQGLFRNPLADPAIIGVSSGAALGAVLAILGGAAAVGGGLGVAAAAFGGALLTALLVYRLARVGPVVQVATLLLAGIAVAAVISSAMTLVLSFSGEQVRNIYRWLLGGLAARGWSSLRIVGPLAAVGGAAAAASVHELNLLALGEERAAQLGLEVERFKRRAIAIGALLAAGAVSVGGIIGFVGLMTPHLLRIVVGADHRRLLPTVALAGPTLLILADLAARVALAPEELPVGAITALLGAPFFLFLLRRERRSAGAAA